MPALFTDRSAERTREAAGWVIAVLGGFGVSAVLSVAGQPRQYFAGAWYMLVVAVASLVGGWRAGALAVLAASGGLLWAVLPPRRELSVDDAGDVGALLAFLAAAIVLVVLVRSRDRVRLLAEERSARSTHLAELTAALSRAIGVEDVAAASLSWCRDSLGATRALLALSPDDRGHGTREEWWSDHRLVDDELRAGADDLFEHGGALRASGGLVAARLSAPTGPVGVLVTDLGPSAVLDDEDREALTVAAANIAHAVARARLHEREHAVADELQRSLLPADLPRVGGFEARAWFRPSAHDTVAGDFYDVVVAGEHWTAVIGDVSGKGVEAAAAATAARHTFRAAALHNSSAEETAHMIDRAVAALHQPGMYCTVVVAAGRQDDGRATVVVAGHPTPLVVRHAGQVEVLEGSGPVLGALPDVVLEPTAVHLDPGDTLVVYTDGLTTGDAGPIDVAEQLAGATTAQLPGRLDRLRSPGGRDDVALLALTRT